MAQWVHGARVGEVGAAKIGWKKKKKKKKKKKRRRKIKCRRT